MTFEYRKGDRVRMVRNEVMVGTVRWVGMNKGAIPSISVDWDAAWAARQVAQFRSWELVPLDPDRLAEWLLREEN